MGLMVLDKKGNRAMGIRRGQMVASTAPFTNASSVSVEKLKSELQKITKNELFVDIAEVRKAETNAQLVATGRRHAAIVANHDDIEARAMRSGKRSGDLVHPLPYAPEFYRKEFSSRIADLRNSVKDRANAQSSCAGQFLNEHLRAHKGLWAHIDLAGPAVARGRGTGFGVTLLLGLLGLYES